MSTQPGPVPLNPDGTPNLGIIATPGSSLNGSQTGLTNIWNLPSDLAGQSIWYDTGLRPGPVHNTEHRGAGGEVFGTPGVAPSKVSYNINSTPEQIMSQMAAMSYNDPAKYIAIQTLLAQGTWGTVHVNGSWDADTEKALAGAMKQYLQLTHGASVGVSFTDYLTKTSGTNQLLTGTGKGGSAAAPTVVTDPTQIRAAAQSAAEAALGKGLSEDQLNAFVAQFQASQKAADLTTTGMVSAPDLSAQAMQYVQTAEPHAYHGEQRQSYLDALVNLFSGPGATGRPSMTPVPSATGAAA